MIKCYICGQVLTASNASDEHIILNALGGHIHSRQLLCKACNSQLGQKADAELAKQLEFCASFLDIPRQRGENRRIETEREAEYHLLPGGKPELKKPLFSVEKQENGMVRIEMVSRNEAEARKMLKGLKKDYPNLDIAQAMQQAVRRKEYLNDKLMVSMGIDGKKIFPSIVKTAVEFYLWKGGDSEHIWHLIPYIKGEQELDICWYFYPDEPVVEDVDTEILHVIHICGDTQEECLYAYVSLFGVVQCLIMLNDVYKGVDFRADYCYEVNLAEEKAYLFRVEYTKEEIMNNIRGHRLDWKDGFLEACKNFLRKANTILRNRVSERLLHEAMENSFGKYPEGIPMTQEMLNDFLKELEKEYYPWLARMLTDE